jgi:hypothetical protein
VGTGNRPDSQGLASAGATSDVARSGSAHVTACNDDGAGSAREPAASAPDAVASAADAASTASKARARAQGPRRREYPVPEQLQQLETVLEYEEFGALDEDEEADAGVRASWATPAPRCVSVHALVPVEAASTPLECRCTARRRTGRPRRM